LKKTADERFERLLGEHQSLVFSIALRLLRDRALAEELAQDVFVQLYEHLDKIESEDHVKYWLRRVTVHRSIDEVRRRKLRPKLCLEEVPEPSSRPASPDVLMDDMLRKFVAALPDKARAIVTLRFQEDLDPIEISRVMDLPASSVKSLLHRSLRLLRSKVERAAHQPQMELKA
jgi:RNA polymerase sigma-70 factor (ECF subfamily)